RRGGKILMPSFAVGRGQEIMVILDKYNVDLPVYVDGMIYDASAIHSTYPKYLAYNLQRQIIDENKNPFESEKFIHVTNYKEREQLLKDEKPCIIIATSGMMNGGPILEYFKNFASDPKNTLAFVGYQAQGTLGSKIQQGHKEVEMQDGTKVAVNLQIRTLDGLSGHSDRKQLLNFIGHLKEKPRRVIINHGEQSKVISLAEAVEKIFGIESYAPRNLEAVRFI
ncbi:MAG: beta-CASP ribonuclease aCPSF1, partial [Candidatus Aenigmarchaeota archaeon]|nr:beta-CASP ribonuclease aCPSF1 [Candidatus Aenigmarchaeota archaeon]